jgi:hypothetical protein
MAFGWSAPTSAFGSVVRNPKRSAVTGPSLTFRVDVHCDTQIPAKNASGLLSSNANQAGGRFPFGCSSGSAKLVQGTTQRLAGPS